MDELKAFIERRFATGIRSHFQLEAQAGAFADFPSNLHPALAGVLRLQGIDRLYIHQLEAFEQIAADRDTLLISSTASGKTLSFFLPILNAYLSASAPFSVLLLYPTKALSRDQESTFGRLMQVVQKDSSLGTFDGDTPRDERQRIQRSADFVITNPDMLHGGILPNHNRKWKTFLSRLRYVVVDEVHSYRGAFGSHVSNVFRRLTRIAELHGSRPVFVCSSATVGNPGDLVNALFHRDFQIIANDGSPRAPRAFFFINPSLVQSHGHSVFRKGTASIAIPLIREACSRRIRTICFCRSRQEAERLHRAVIDHPPQLAAIVKPYRGGLLPNERRRLEKDLVEGRLNAIITTNALELGIDIGDLELCILSGHPGTMASFWQQSGRVGRQTRPSTVVFVAKDNPIDQYLVHHPDFISCSPIEEALLNGDNPYIMLQHLPCMAFEHPLRDTEPGWDPLVYQEARSLLQTNGTVIPYRNTLRYALQDYPARGVNLRGMTDYNIEIYCGSEVIGELDPIGARGTLYKDAIYQHLGKRYLSLDLDLEQKLCRVAEVAVDYFTEAHWEGRVEMRELESTKTLGEATLSFGQIYCNRQPKLYKKIRERTYENIGYGPITLPPFEYDTTGFSLVPPRSWILALQSVDRRFIGAALYGLSYLLPHTAPALCMADLADLQTEVALAAGNTEQWHSALYLFDAIEGGVGYAEKVFEKIETGLDLCRQVLVNCECLAGCPSCVPSLPPGVANDELECLLVVSDSAVVCTHSLIKALLENIIEIPEVAFFETPLSPLTAPPPEDGLRKQIRRQLTSAANLLKRKRERIH